MHLYQKLVHICVWAYVCACVWEYGKSVTSVCVYKNKVEYGKSMIQKFPLMSHKIARFMFIFHISNIDFINFSCGYVCRYQDDRQMLMFHQDKLFTVYNAVYVHACVDLLWQNRNFPCMLIIVHIHNRCSTHVNVEHACKRLVIRDMQIYSVTQYCFCFITSSIPRLHML